jgi:hypothetical protein
MVIAFERAQQRKPSAKERALLLDMLENPTPALAEALSVATPGFDMEISIIKGVAHFRFVPKEGDSGDQIAFAT